MSNQIDVDIVPTEATKEQRGDERTEALAAAAPTSPTKKVAEEEVAKETKIAEPELERPTTSRSTERADLVAATHGRAEPAVPTTNGVAEAAPDVAKKDQIPTEEIAGVVTAGGVATVAGATALAGAETGEGRTQPGMYLIYCRKSQN
jgi:cell division ATPase FtsA